jgi:hypothetical protein
MYSSAAALSKGKLNFAIIGHSAFGGDLFRGGSAEIPEAVSVLRLLLTHKLTRRTTIGAPTMVFNRSVEHSQRGSQRSANPAFNHSVKVSRARTRGDQPRQRGNNGEFELISTFRTEAELGLSPRRALRWAADEGGCYNISTSFGGFCTATACWTE